MTIRSNGLTGSTDAKRDEQQPDSRKSEGARFIHGQTLQSLAEPEDTDLERRVLAHSRILQALIAHMAESQPDFVERLDSAFGGQMRVSRPEHDFTDTDSYADQFIRGIRRVDDREKVAAPGALDAALPAPFDPVPTRVNKPEIVPTLLRLGRRAGVWQLTKDGVFYGDYYEQQSAFDAANAAALAIAANGGAADILIRGERPRR